MPSQEPNSKMDELLRAYARKRREQAEPLAEIHPATRKLLQDEVKRTLAATPAPTSSRASWRFWRWPLLAMWGGMAVMLVMFAVLNAQFRSLAPANEKEESRSKKEENNRAVTRKLSSPAALAKKDSTTLDTRAPQDNRSAGVPLESQAAAPAPVATTLAARSENAITPMNLSSAAAERAVSPVPAPASVAPPSISDLARSRKAAAGSASFARPAPAAPAPLADVVDGNFVQIRDRAGAGSASLPPSNLLSNFRMTRSGQQVRVLDADGSVYNGRVLNGFSNRAGFGGGGGAQNQAKAFKDGMDATNWTFNVTGRNHSLQQDIIFTGDVLDMPWNDGAAPHVHASQLQNRSNASQAPSTQNSRIMGKVQVGGGKPYVIEAKPPNP